MLLVSFYTVKRLLLAPSEPEKKENSCDLMELLWGHFHLKVLPGLTEIKFFLTTADLNALSTAVHPVEQ